MRLRLTSLCVVVAVALTACKMSDARYVDLLTRADSAMSARQARLRQDFRIGSYHRFDYDEATGIFVFSDSGIARVLADAQFVGTVSRRDSTWQWAWRLPYISPGLAAASWTARRYGWLHGVRRLQQTGWKGDDGDGWEMTSLTGFLAGAEAGYRAPSSDSTLYTFMLLRNVRWAPPGRSVDSYVVSPRAGP